MDIKPYTLVQWNGQAYHRGITNPLNVWGYVTSGYIYSFSVRWPNGHINTYMDTTLIINTKSWT